MFSASAAVRRLAIVCAVLIGAAAVILSWRVPEPSRTESRPAVAPISHERCVQQAPPSYGTRSLSNPVAIGC